MNVLVMRPGPSALDYSYFMSGRREPVAAARLTDYRWSGDEWTRILAEIAGIREKCVASSAGGPDAVAILAPYGGTEFGGPVLAGDDTVIRLKTLVPFAPLHLPVTIIVAEAARQVMPDVPVVFFFETAFFADLPARERLYGLDADTTKALGLRRFGYHGIFHETACSQASREAIASAGDAAGHAGEQGRHAAARILSICLEPRPELAAVIGARAVMVTSGATPLEGLPGETTCGEIDPSIVLTLARKLHWGPEEVNAALTRESGLAGLVGRPVTLGEALASADGEVAVALEIFKYRLLLACGAGLAAMGGVDAIVLSGRYARLGAPVAAWLVERLTFPGVPRTAPIRIVIFDEQLDRILADAAPAAVLSAGVRAA